MLRNLNCTHWKTERINAKDIVRTKVYDYKIVCSFETPRTNFKVFDENWKKNWRIMDEYMVGSNITYAFTY